MPRPRQPLVYGGRVTLEGDMQIATLHIDSPLLYRAALKHLHGRVTITIAPEQETRRQKQNRYYWAAVVKSIADETGHTRDQIHEILKYKFNSEVVEMVDPTTGEAEELKVPKSTTKLSVKDFAVYVDQCVLWAAEFLGIALPESDDRRAA